MCTQHHQISLVGMLLAALVAVDAGSDPAAADTTVADFYQGKTVNMIIGSASGGGFDAYARIIGRYMTKYLPGRPTIVPQNLVGGGGFAAGHRVAIAAPQDGSHIGAIHPTTIVDPVLGDPRKGTKALEFAYLGSASSGVEACFLRADAPVKSFRDAFGTEMILGAGNQASSSREYAALLKNVLGMKITIVGGYSGTAQIMLAMDRGEVQGMCGASYLGVVAARPDWFTNNLVKVISYQGTQSHPELKWMADVLPAVTFAKTNEQRQILNLYDSQEAFARPYVTGTKVPPERTEALRAAFMSALDDPELRKEATGLGLDVSPVSGPQVQALVANFYSASPEILRRTRVALGYE
jgi:tripartite-type tricarboxylate transporter receptor subunit TctC